MNGIYTSLSHSNAQLNPSSVKWPREVSVLFLSRVLINERNIYLANSLKYAAEPTQFKMARGRGRVSVLSLSRVLINERDIYLANSLNCAAEPMQCEIAPGGLYLYLLRDLKMMRCWHQLV